MNLFQNIKNFLSSHFAPKAVPVSRAMSVRVDHFMFPCRSGSAALQRAMVDCEDHLIQAGLIARTRQPVQNLVICLNLGNDRIRISSRKFFEDQLNDDVRAIPLTSLDTLVGYRELGRILLKELDKRGLYFENKNAALDGLGLLAKVWQGETIYPSGKKPVMNEPTRAPSI